MALLNQADGLDVATRIVGRVDRGSPLRRHGIQLQIVPLTDFGTVNFAGLSAVGKATNPKTGFTQTQITMKSGTTVKATPSALSPAGTAFSVSWDHS